MKFSTPLITFRQVTLHYGTHLNFNPLNFVIEAKERVALIGRNGAGKSTLLKLMMKTIVPDQGIIEYATGVTLTVLPQEVPVELTGDIFSIVAQGLTEQNRLLSEYHELQHQLQNSTEETLIQRFNELQHEMAITNAWSLQQQVDSILSLMSLAPTTRFETLSGGMKRRVLLAQALVSKPDMLLLDEPTNHLDMDAIIWLEDFLLSLNTTLIFVTHDRRFLQRLATRILDLDRGNITSWETDYATYLQRKEALLEEEERHWGLFDKKLAAEEAWIRQGIKARRTRNEGRVRALEQLRKERRARRERVGQVALQTQLTHTASQLTLVAENISFQQQDKMLIHNFSTIISRGDKIGLIGPNGVGKTTLIRLLLGTLSPTTGTVLRAPTLQIAYYDQLRSELREQDTVLDNVAEGQSALTINGQTKHIMSYLQDFLFSPERVRMKVAALSGGERNRVMLAKLFTKPFNLLVMDEPTNDLDIETLALLEELLVLYTGTLLLVSHDREFLNNVVTSMLVFEGNRINEYIGGYNDWLTQKPTRLVEKNLCHKKSLPLLMLKKMKRKKFKNY